MSGRYAIYFAPAPGSPWRAFGAHWLGRDEITGRALAARLPAAADHAALTEEPRRYGWHATLKAPFRLRGGRAPLLERTEILARQLHAVAMGPLVPAVLDGFVALVPSPQQEAVGTLAMRCVVELDDLRLPATPEELARRRPDALDARGRQLLDAFGYPHVMERFRFHMTLTGRIPAARAAAVIQQVAPVVARLNAEEPLRLDRLCVFHQSDEAAPFLRIHDAEFAR